MKYAVCSEGYTIYNYYENAFMKSPIPNLAAHKSLADRVYDAICAQIADGSLKPKERITENGIAELLNISRGPVREALTKLARDQLIRMIPRSGYYVSSISADEIIEIYEVRKRIECLALEFAFDKFDCDKMKELKEKFEECLHQTGGEFSRQAYELDCEFHDLISRTSGKKTVNKMLNELSARIRLFISRDTQYIEDAKSGIADHIGIIDAILENDLKKAVDILEYHITGAKEIALEIARNMEEQFKEQKTYSEKGEVIAKR